MCPARLALVVSYIMCAQCMTAKFFIVFLYTHGLITLTLSKMYVMMPSTRQKRHDNDKHDSDKAVASSPGPTQKSGKGPGVTCKYSRMCCVSSLRLE